jgi:hypothetical protein
MGISNTKSVLLVYYQYDTGEIKLYPSGGHDSACSSPVILGKIAAWRIKTYVSTPCKIYLPTSDLEY